MCWKNSIRQMPVELPLLTHACHSYNRFLIDGSLYIRLRICLSNSLPKHGSTEMRLKLVKSLVFPDLWRGGGVIHPIFHWVSNTFINILTLHMCNSTGYILKPACCLPACMISQFNSNLFIFIHIFTITNKLTGIGQCCTSVIRWANTSTPHNKFTLTWT